MPWRGHGPNAAYRCAVAVHRQLPGKVCMNAKTSHPMFGRKKKVCVVTACGDTKRDVPLPARRLYKPPRITVVHNRKCGCDMYILSAKHGLIPSEKVIEPYDMDLGRGRIAELLPDMVPVLKKYDKVIFFKAGAAYDECMKAACDGGGLHPSASCRAGRFLPCRPRVMPKPASGCPAGYATSTCVRGSGTRMLWNQKVLGLGGSASRQPHV